MIDYQAFLRRKRIQIKPVGFDVDPATLNPMLFPFQRDIVTWALKRGVASGLRTGWGLKLEIMRGKEIIALVASGLRTGWGLKHITDRR